MDHHGMPYHHWGYGEHNSNNNVPKTWNSVPSQGPVTRSNSLKRPLSESDDDVFSEESSTKEQCTSPSNADSCQLMSRKKRRGVIEKKRRDRINSSLLELKKLVPSAIEKQGSAKLEKAEILQMTVDHLKNLHAKGLDNFAYDPHKFAIEYQFIGFRECASEVARYLGTIEGMDMQDPLRLRLMSHLQCFVTQRELATKQSTSTPPVAPSNPSTWGYPAPPPAAQHPGFQQPTHHQGAYGAPSAHNIHASFQPTPPPLQPTSHILPQSSHLPSLHDHNISLTDLSGPNTMRYHTLSTTNHISPCLTQNTTLTPLTSTTTSVISYPHQYQNIPYPPTTSSDSNSSQMKPYRPWGAEVAY